MDKVINKLRSDKKCVNYIFVKVVVFYGYVSRRN